MPLGYSVGRWDGEALVVTTTHIDWPYFELYGLGRRAAKPADAHRRALHAARRQRHVAIRLGRRTDPVEPNGDQLLTTNYVTFRFNPSLEFLPYDCVEDERRARHTR